MKSDGPNVGKRVTDISGQLGDGIVLGHDAVIAIVKFDNIDGLMQVMWDDLELLPEGEAQPES